MRVVIMVAVAANGVIGSDNQLPWHLPEDLRRFRDLTFGHPVIMGRRTFESIGRPLPGRTNIVLSRDHGFAPDGCIVVHDLDRALEQAAAVDQDVAFIIGGAEVYRQTVEVADRIEMTVINHSFAGDTVFPALDDGRWRCDGGPVQQRTGEPSFAFEYRTYVRAESP